MIDDGAVITTFLAERERLLGLARRLLGSAAEAEDVLQEAWLRLSSVETDRIDNFRAWLTTVVSRIALDMLRARRTRSDDLEAGNAGPSATLRDHTDPEQDAMLAESIGIALLVVLDRIPPLERLAFVLHDLFGLPFADVGHILARSSDAARQLASRGRRRVQGPPSDARVRCSHQREAVAAFYAASREGDFEALIALLDPQAELIINPGLTATDRQQITRGSTSIARRASLGGASQRAAALVFVSGRAAIAVAPGGVLQMLMLFERTGQLISRIEIVSDPDRLNILPISVT